VPYSHFEQVIPYTDLFLYDIKCLDSALHSRGTGSGNARILENLTKLQSAGCRIMIRIPCIPDFNEGEEVERVCRYCEERGLPYEVLAYHRFGEDKAKALYSI
jgi:pyruvate formate lyase activating enzyme